MSAPVRVGDIIAGRYRIDDVLGHGGMGVVLMATHLVLDQRVAIKFLRREAMVDANAVERFVREAQAAARVQSEHVVRVHDVAQLEDGTPFIVMEYVEGMVLSTLLASRGPLAAHEALRYAVQTCEALAETHAAGIVHGDLKPDNIYIAGTSSGGLGRVKLLDFGISRILAPNETSTSSAFIMGTPAYMAPEQFGAAKVDARADLWAVGVLLYEMLSGAPPFAGDTPDQIRRAVLTGAVAPLQRPDLPAALEKLILQCLQKDPMWRYESASQLGAALAALQGLTPPAAIAPPAPVSPRSQRTMPTVVLPNRRRSGGTWTFAALAGFAVISVVLMVFTVSSSQRRAASPAPTTEAPSPVEATDEAALIDLESLTFEEEEDAEQAEHAEATPEHAEIGEAEAEPAPDPDALVTAPAAATATRRRTRARPARTVAPRPPAAQEGDRFGTRK